MNGLLDFLTPDQQQALRQQATTQGLLGLGSALLQGSTGAPGQGRPRLGQLLGQAIPAGLQGYQGGMDQALQQIMLSQQMQDMQKKREQQARSEAARQQFARQFAPVTPQTALQAPGPVGPTVARAETIGQTPALDRNQLLAQMLNPDLPPDLRSTAADVFQATTPAKPEPASSEFRNYQQAVAQGYAGSFVDYQKELKAAGRSQVTATATAGGGKDLTPGQKKTDERFADDFVAWQTGGGQDMTAQLAQLKPVINALESGQPITGISTAVQPDILLAITNPKALQAREAVEEVVQRNLRVILGAQFTEKEGERLISRAFNPKLPPEENAKRVRRLFKQMETAATQKQQMVDYFNQLGTLKGFQGKMPSVRDFENAMEGDAVTQPTGVRRFNPATGRVE